MAKYTFSLEPELKRLQNEIDSGLGIIEVKSRLIDIECGYIQRKIT